METYGGRCRTSVWAWAVGGQSAAVFAMLLLSIILPPREGPMLIVPLWPATTGKTLDWALAQDALLLGAGPWSGSLVVRAKRSKLMRAAVSNGAILINVPAAFCGASLLS